MAYNLRHTFRRGTTFYYNRRVPKGVDDAFGCSVVRLNLGCDPEKALQLSEALTDKLDELWSSPRVVPVDLNQLHLGLLPQRFDLLSCLDAYLEVRDICEKPVRLAVRALTHVAGNKEITDYTRTEAKQLIHTLTKKGNKSATVRRRLQSLHAVFEFGFHELEIDKRNPFARLMIPREGRDVTKRGVFRDDQLQKLYSAALASGKDTRLILPILGETGARLAEIVGLRWEDVNLDDGVVRIVPHPYRGLKTRGSEREVPLVGDALRAMLALANNRDGGDFVFSRWLRPEGFASTHASNTLNQFLSSRYAGLTCHCFRHTMRDRLRNAGAPMELIDNIGGWSSAGGVGVRYGYGFNLDRKREFMERIAIRSD